MQTLELEDIQGYIIRGYKHMQYSRFVQLMVTDAAAAKKFINSISDDITNATHIPNKELLPKTCLNLAFTSSGLSALGLSDKNMQNFTREFREGMTTPHRQRLLGDFGSSAPEQWLWGSKEKDPVHICLLIFGCTLEICMKLYNELKEQYSNSGLKEITHLDGQTLSNNKEHFGYRDGISQPTIMGSGRTGPPHDDIKPGEFVLGYKNEYDVFPDTPLLAAEQGSFNLLPSDAGGSGQKDMGRNGSYLVMRQMLQDVKSYWTFINNQTLNEDGSVNVQESLKLGAKMMGRWQSGAPVVKYPDKDPGAYSDDNDFGYNELDKDGTKCPYGSHLRRSNPRDNFEDDTIKESWRLTKRHRIIRRARLYGEPYEGGPTNLTPNGEVGLLFLCFNADISRQFEFIQYTWANFPKFKELYNDPDPVIGVRETPDHDQEQNFTIQDNPVSRVIPNLKRHIYIRGGAYFFFPSITTIRFLATL